MNKLYILFIFLPFYLFAGVTGKIAGRVIDKSTGEPLIGANVVIEGTHMGAACDKNGNYFIINVPPGVYSVKASMIGYAPVTKDGVVVSVDLTTNVNFELEPTAIKVPGIVIKAKRPLITPDVTATTKRSERKEMIKQPIHSTDAVLTSQAGVVYSEGGASGVTGGIHIRGGRADEVVYYVDGMSIMDPIVGRRGADISIIGVQEMATLTGGFNAEYGQAMSGIVNIVTPEGRKFGGIFRGMNDKLATYSEGRQRYEISLGGPIAKNLRYFFSSEILTRRENRSWNNSYLTQFINECNTLGKKVKLAEDWKTDAIPCTDREYYSLQSKLTYEIFKGLKMNVSGFITRNQYGTHLRNIIDKYTMPRYRYSDFRKAYQFTSTITHQVSPSIFYSLQAGLFNTITIFGRRDQKYEKERGFLSDYKFYPWWYDVPQFREEYSSPGWYAMDKDSNYYYPYGVPGIFRTYWAYGLYEKRISKYFQTKFDLTYQCGQHHQLKFGSEIRNYLVIDRELGQYIAEFYRGPTKDTLLPEYAIDLLDTVTVLLRDSITPTGDTIQVLAGREGLRNCLYNDIYRESPKEFAIYLQDKIEYPGFVINAGLRLDCFNPNTWRFRDPLYPFDTLGNFDTTRAKTKVQISPRFGISFPVTEKTVFRLAYGHFFQRPTLRWLYDGYNIPLIKAAGGWGIVGNPDLSAQHTIQYETGISHQFLYSIVLDISAFYKDIYNLIGSRYIPAQPQGYTAYETEDYGNVNGLEFSISKPIGKWVTGGLTYTLSFANGTSSWEREAYYDYIANVPVDPYTGLPFVLPKTVYPLEFDQRHVINNTLLFTLPKEIKYVGNTEVSAITRIGSGLPYTQRDTRDYIVGVTNAKRLPWNQNTDLRITKYFSFGKLKPYLFIEVSNLFNRKNILYVYEATDKTDDNGLLSDYATYIDQTFPKDYLSAGKIPVYKTRGQNVYWQADERRDMDGDGYITTYEWYRSYYLAYKDFLYRPDRLYSSPRHIEIGIAIEW